MLYCKKNFSFTLILLFSYIVPETLSHTKVGTKQIFHLATWMIFCCYFIALNVFHFHFFSFALLLFFFANLHSLAHTRGSDLAGSVRWENCFSVKTTGCCWFRWITASEESWVREKSLGNGKMACNGEKKREKKWKKSFFSSVLQQSSSLALLTNLIRLFSCREFN